MHLARQKRKSFMNAGVKIILRSTMYVDGKELGIWNFVRFHPPELTRAVFNSQCSVVLHVGVI